MTDMTRRRLGALIETYGADPERWPAEERAPAEALLARSPEFAADLALARRIDIALDEASLAPAGADLRRRILAVPDRRPAWREILDALWPFESVLRPAAGLATAAVLGIVVGVTTPPAIATSSNDITVESAEPTEDVLLMIEGAVGVETEILR
jgi:hypothetical protein